MAGASGRSKKRGAKRPAAPTFEEVPVSREETMAQVEEASGGKRKQKSYYLTEDLLERINAAVYWSRAGYVAAKQRGEELDVSELPDNASQLVERAATAEVLRLEKLFNGGERFEPAPGKLAVGPGESGAARLRQGRGGKKS